MKAGVVVAIIAVLAVIVGTAVFLVWNSTPETVEHIDTIMELTSPAFEEGSAIPAKYTCDGENVNPPLAISGVPNSAATLALVMDDPDAVKPAGKVWDHWIVWNVPADTTEVSEGEEPVGVHGTGTGGNTAYSGPCPPDAEHTYRFTLYALDVELELSAGATKAELESAMEGHVLEQVTLTGTYNRT